MKIVTKTILESEKCAKDFVSRIFDSPKKLKSARVFGLHGDLGAGKTTFMQGVAKAFGVKEDVTSPTFVIEKLFKLKGGQFEHLVHIDAYRLESSRELVNLGWKEISENLKNIIFIEWPEKVADILPKHIENIYFTHIDENTREISFE
ncbi:MAG: tRNA (adenosine(37)-N6)-threonylcarbamoyltransferase complex ATPase subunit type 1 TsaE [Candidatus Pacebacteria bacterium]|nr:tRNA (adenosine(37)-N6)-threonylcarbamoyltransferase complex ATPase subunit type 1 TsaE [Candidatus Paceibacterota bacterium]